MTSSAQDHNHDYRPRAAASEFGHGDRFTRQTFAFVLAGGRGERLRQLTEHRAKPAVPMAGHLKIIDFPLSNCVNSGLRRVAVLTQYKAQSLIRHVERGWGFLSGNLGEFVEIAPAQQRLNTNWYRGTADAVHQNVELLREIDARYTLILAGDHVYKMDYSIMIEDHVRSAADATVACVDAPIADAVNFGVIQVDGSWRVVEFHEKPANPEPVPGSSTEALVSMGIYVFNTHFLIEQLAADAADPHSSHDFGRDVIPGIIQRHAVRAHRFADSCVNMVRARPYWRDVGTVDAYYEANIDLTKVEPELNLYDDDWPILSLQPQLPPAKFVFEEPQRRGTALDSLVSSGCIVSGATVRRSLLSSKVRVGDRSLIEDSVILPNVVIGRDVVLRRAVIDKRCVLPDGFQAGLDVDHDRARFYVSERGVVLVTPRMLEANA